MVEGGRLKKNVEWRGYAFLRLWFIRSLEFTAISGATPLSIEIDNLLGRSIEICTVTATFLQVIETIDGYEKFKKKFEIIDFIQEIFAVVIINAFAILLIKQVIIVV